GLYISLAIRKYLLHLPKRKYLLWELQAPKQKSDYPHQYTIHSSRPVILQLKDGPLDRTWGQFYMFLRYNLFVELQFLPASQIHLAMSCLLSTFLVRFQRAISSRLR